MEIRSQVSSAKKTIGRVSTDESLDLWKAYKQSRDPGQRDRLILTFAPMVKYIVYRKLREIPARCDMDDFISCGLEALIRSIDRYDQRMGEIAKAHVGSLNALLNEDETSLERIDTLVSEDRHADPEARAMRDEAKARFRAASSDFPSANARSRYSYTCTASRCGRSGRSSG